MTRRIAIGMSGGVDSSVAAMLLKRAGYQVTGVFIRSWDDDGNCPAGEDAAAAAAVAQHLDIELEAADFTAEYREQVFADFLAELRAGRTPNPDVWCNAHIKFGAFARHALDSMGVDAIATGHYARTGDAGAMLLKAADRAKDQTYFLYRMPAAILPRCRFPLGDLRKGQVRELAREAGLPSARRPESMGICFVGKRPFREFIAEHMPPSPGELVSPEGEVVGAHDGLHLHTIGQRHGLGLGGPGEPWYVAAKETATNRITVVRGRDHPLLLSAAIALTDCSWLQARVVRTQWVYTCRYRHGMEPTPCVISRLGDDGSARLEFAEPQWGLAPGQAAVVYDGNHCLGGGTIEQTAGVEN